MSWLDFLFGLTKPLSIRTFDTVPKQPAPKEELEAKLVEPITLKFESDRVRREWNSGQLDPLLVRIVQAAALVAAGLGWQFLVFCLYRTPEENDELYGGTGTHLTGVHVTWRGADIRTRDQNGDVVAQIVQFLNNHWVYDPTRPGMLVALLEAAGLGSTGPHLHIQVHARTVPTPVA